MPGLVSALRTRFLRFRREIVVMAYALLDRETPGRLRLGILAILLYLASPFDLLPELIPILGVLDDLAIVPWAVSLLVRRLPEPERERAEARAKRFLSRYLARPLTFAAVLLLTLLALWALILWLTWLRLT